MEVLAAFDEAESPPPDEGSPPDEDWPPDDESPPDEPVVSVDVDGFTDDSLPSVDGDVVARDPPESPSRRESFR